MRTRSATFARQFPATTLLLAAYLAVYLAMTLWQRGLTLSSSPLYALGILPNTLFHFGSIDTLYVLDFHQYWRLLTATFLHGSLMHLLLNGAALYQLGPIIEYRYRGGVLLFFQAFFGVAANVATVAYHHNERFQQIGASGVLFGLLAFLVVSSMGRDNELDRRLVRVGAVCCLMGLALGALLGADNVAHGAGLAAGALAGLLEGVLRPGVLAGWVVRGAGFATLITTATAFTVQARHASALDANEQATPLQRLEINTRRSLEIRRLVAQLDRLLAVKPPRDAKARESRKLQLQALLDRLKETVGHAGVENRLATLLDQWTRMDTDEFFGSASLSAQRQILLRLFPKPIVRRRPAVVSRPRASTGDDSSSQIRRP